MLREDNSNRKRATEACYSLLTITMGFLSCSIIALLIYYSCQTVTGNLSYCSLWTDIPGRIALFLTFYYAAGVCGTLPIPKRMRVNFLPPPFVIYKLESWENLFGKLCRLLAVECHGYESPENDPVLSPDECNEHKYNSTPAPTVRGKSENIQISKSDTSKKLAVRSIIKAARHTEPKITSSSEDTSMSFDSSIAGQIVPIVKGKSSKPRYITDSSTTTTGSTSNPISVDTPSDKFYGVSETLKNRAKAVARVCDDDDDTPPRTPDIVLPLPSYPRFPWSYLKQASGVPDEAKALHKRHLLTEKRELSKLQKKQKVEGAICSSNDSNRSWITDSDEFSHFANRPLRPPLIPLRTKTGFRSRTITTPGSIRKLGKIKTKTHKRVESCFSPPKYKPEPTQKIRPKHDVNSSKLKDLCCESSLDIKIKVERIQKTLMRFDPSYKEVSKATTSKEGIDDFSSKISDSNSGTKESTQDTETCSGKIPESCANETSISAKNIGSSPDIHSDSSSHDEM